MMTKPNLEDRNEIIVKLRGWVLHVDHTQKKKKVHEPKWSNFKLRSMNFSSH